MACQRKASIFGKNNYNYYSYRHSPDLPKDCTWSQLRQHLIISATNHLHETLVHNVHLLANLPLHGGSR